MGVVEERSLFLEIVSLYRVLPITTDSHFGEYIGWAWDVADHDGTKEFYSRYRKYMLFNKGLPAERLQRGTEEEEFWRVVHIIAGIVADSGHEELAVNIPNDDFIEALPRNQIVEVPAVIDRNGTKGIRLDSYPRVFSGLLQSEEPLHDRLTATILTRSKEAVLQTLLLDPVVDRVQLAEDLLNRVLDLQTPYLDCLQ